MRAIQQPIKTPIKYYNPRGKENETQIKEYAAIVPKAIAVYQTTVEFLRENCYKHPTLALAYYYRCSVNPRALIWNDELGTSIDNSATWVCISDLIRDRVEKKKLFSVNRFLKLLINHMPKLLHVHLAVNAY